MLKFQPVIRSRERQHPLIVKIVKQLLIWINSGASIGEYEKDRMVKEEWGYNSLSISLLGKKEEYYTRTGPFKFLNYLIGDSKVVKFFLGELTFFTPREALFSDIIREKSQFNYLCVPAWNVNTEIRQQIGLIRSFLLRLMLAIQFGFEYFVYILFATFFPVFYLCLRGVRGIRFYSRKSLKEFIVSIPVVWGVYSEGDNIRGGVKKQIDDSYLYGSQLSSGDILHVFGKWKFTGKEELNFKTTMQDRGYPYISLKDFKLTPKLLLLIVRLQLKSFVCFIYALAGFKISREMVLMSKSLIKAIFYYFDKHLELENINCRAELVKDDYNPGHVIRSIVLRSYDVVSVGVQHTASPYDAPQLAYVDLDYYSVFGQFYVDLFAHSWGQLKLIKSGREIIDPVYHLAKNTILQKTLENKYFDLYGTSQFRVVLLIPGPNVINRTKMWKEMYNGLAKVAKMDMDFHVILRLRKLSYSKDYEYIQKIVDLTESDSRFISEQSGFTTQELMSISDLVITPNSSFGINEALVLGKPVFTFDLTGAAQLYFSNYGSDFVMESANDFVVVFSGLNNNFCDLNCEWGRLAKDLNYEPKGKNCEKLGEAICKAVN